VSRPEFESVVAGAPRESLKRTIINPTGTLNTSATRNIDIFSNPGSVSRLVSMSIFFEKLSGGVSHYVELKYSNATNSLFFTFAYGSSNNINYATNSFIGSPLSFAPSPIADFRLCYQNLFFDNSTGLRFTYTNNTGAIKNFDTSSNYIEIYAIEQQISS
jgi:hypothetical protein